MKKKFLACLLAGTMVLSMAACGNDDSQASGSAPSESGSEPVESTPESTPEPETTQEPVAEDASIDFEDGNMGFVSSFNGVADAADLELSVADFNGSKALQVKNLTGKVPYVAIDATSLLGADVTKVASMELTIGVSYEDGSFNACSGKILAWSGEDLKESSDDWSVYLEKKNPMKSVATLSAGEEFVADAGNMFVLRCATDNGAAAGAGSATLYIDNIRFLDASGNLLTADSSATFVQNDKFGSSGPDVMNLAFLQNPVTFEGFACKADGWAQAGADMPQEILDALVPGSVVEISYTSETGDMWIVMNGAEAGWMRVGDGALAGSEGHSSSYYNSGRNVCQVTYEQIAELCGEDVSTWGASMQCESNSPWEVYSVRVGQASPYYTVDPGAVEFAGFACKADAWNQAGADMPQEIIDALVPGSVVEISYTSETGDLWVVMNGAEAGWMRVGDGTLAGSEGHDLAVCDGSKCYVTYEQIAALCGEDVSTWGASMQCESNSAWEVYSVRVGTAVEFQMMRDPVTFEGFACKADAWNQAGADMPQEIIDALVPGAVVEINYTSETGDMWIVMNGAEAGWMRVGDGTLAGSEGHDLAACNGSVCQVTYEQIAALCGEDVSTWGASMQCESNGAWEVYSVSVGQSK